MDFPTTRSGYQAQSESCTTGEDARQFFSPFRDAATAVTAAGLGALPCGGPTGKAPMVKWKSQHGLISEVRLRQWLADPQFAEANIGIATEPSGITVIDCDTPNSLDELIALFGPTPIMIGMPRGGYHFYYRSAGEGSGPLRSGDLNIDVKGVARAVAGDALHGRDQFVVEDTAIVGPGDGAQLDAAIFDLQGLHLLGTMGGQPVLQVDSGEWRRKLVQVGRPRASEAGELAEAPMRRRDRRIRAGQYQRQALRIVAVRLDPDPNMAEIYRQRIATLYPAPPQATKLTARYTS